VAPFASLIAAITTLGFVCNVSFTVETHRVALPSSEPALLAGNDLAHLMGPAHRHDSGRARGDDERHEEACPTLERDLIGESRRRLSGLR